MTREEVMSDIGIPLKVQLVKYIGEQGDRMDVVMKCHADYQQTIYKDSLALFPGINEMLETLHSRGKKMGIVSSRTKPSLIRYLKHFDLEKYFSLIVTPENTPEHKPSPQPVLCALEQMNSKAGDTVFLGDAWVDINSGSGAGVDTAFASWGPNKQEDLPVRPTWILDKPIDLL